MTDSLFDTINPKPETEITISQCEYIHLKGVRKGMRCDRDAIEGETLCVMHGANVARAKEVIQRRLIALQEKSVAALEILLDSSDAKVCLSAATAILDRTGIGPKSTVNFENLPDLSTMTGDDLVKELENLRSRAKDAASRQRTDVALMTSPSATGSTH